MGGGESEKEEDWSEPSIAGAKLIDAPILFFVVTHKAFRAELALIHHGAAEAAESGDVRRELLVDLARRLEFLKLVSNYHSVAEDEASGVNFDLDFVKQIHCHVIKLGYDHNLFVENALLSAYLIRGSSMDACLVFDEMSEKDVVTWASLISGLISQSNYREALQVFKELVGDYSQPHPNAVTIISTMSACGGLGSMDLTKTFHAFLEKAGWLELDISIANSLMFASVIIL